MPRCFSVSFCRIRRIYYSNGDINFCARNNFSAWEKNMLIAQLIGVICKIELHSNEKWLHRAGGKKAREGSMFIALRGTASRSRWCEGSSGGSSLLVRYSVVRDDHFRHAWARSPFKRYSLPFARAIRFPATQIFQDSRTIHDFVPSNSALAKNCNHFPVTRVVRVCSFQV